MSHLAALVFQPNSSILYPVSSIWFARCSCKSFLTAHHKARCQCQVQLGGYRPEYTTVQPTAGVTETCLPLSPSSSDALSPVLAAATSSPNDIVQAPEFFNPARYRIELRRQGGLANRRPPTRAKVDTTLVVTSNTTGPTVSPLEHSSASSPSRFIADTVVPLRHQGTLYTDSMFPHSSRQLPPLAPSHRTGHDPSITGYTSPSVAAASTTTPVPTLIAGDTLVEPRLPSHLRFGYQLPGLTHTVPNSKEHIFAKLNPVQQSCQRPRP